MSAALQTAELSLLPSNLASTTLALGATPSRLDRLPTIVETLWNPYECPIAWLPFLAETVGVDFWDEDWSDQKKRTVVAGQIKLARKKGTVLALKGYADLADAPIKKIIRPPQRVFSGASLTDADRERWLKGLPQVRVYLPKRTKTQKFQLRAGGPLRSSFFETNYPVPAEPRQRKAVYLNDNGKAVDARVEEMGSNYRLHFPSTRGNLFFSGDISNRYFYIPSSAAKRIFTIAPKSRLPARSPIGPNLNAVIAEPERISETYIRNPHQVFAGDLLNKQFFVSSEAHERIFDRWSILLDKKSIKRSVNRLASQFMGVGFYSWPRHHMRIQTTIKGTSMRLRAGNELLVPHSRFWIPTDKKPLRILRRALGSAKSARDQIKLQLGTSASLALGQPLIVGTSLITGRP